MSSAIITSKRCEWMNNTIIDSLGCKETVWEECLQDQSNVDKIELFLSGEGPLKIFFYYQIQEQLQNDDIKDAGQQDPILFVTYGNVEKIKEKSVWFLRNVNPDQKGQMKIRLEEPTDNDIIWGEITPNTIPHLNHLMEYVYQPALDKLSESKDDTAWGKCNEEAKAEFLSISNKFAKEVNEAITLITPGQELFKLDPEDIAKQQTDAGKIEVYSRKFQQWIQKIKGMLNEDSEQKKDKADDGPSTELDYWRSIMQKITNFHEQLKSHDFQLVKRALMQQNKQESSSRRGDDQINNTIQEYNRLDLQLTDKLNEAKDNVKYLATLEKFIEPLYKGTPQQIIDALPALMNAIKMVHTIARFYNTPEKMTGLFMKITNQMIKNCKERILEKSTKSQDLWKREPSQLIDTLHQCIKLYREYKQCYNDTKEKVADMPKGKQFGFSETQIFQKFEHFVRRLNKLIDIFLNIQQFNALAKHNLEDMDSLTAKFNEIIENFKKNKHDLLDTQNITFDRDWVEFNVQISKLDQELQSFIDANFSRFSDIEYSLKLLKKFEATIRRDPLKHNLKQKYSSILHNYATELDTISRVFKDARDNPSNLQHLIVRNIPSEAGKIVWAKHLFQKITGPISMFPEDVIQSGEIKKYYGAYNALGKSLTIYELWYKSNWINEIERSKAALQATLIVRHDKYAKLWVNFDYEILQLIREAKCLDRQGIDIPESARIILLQEEKFKMYKNELEYALKEYERINSKIKPICKELLQPHLDDLELKLRPGMVTLTWTSMNIDSYLYHVHQGLKKLEQLIINVNDIIENRIEINLKQVSKIILVDLPNDSNPMTLEQFVLNQENFIENETNKLRSKNLEVERAVDDLIQTIILYPLDPHVEGVNADQTKKIKRYYFWYFYQALLNATQNSLNSMKYRVCGKKQQGTNSLQDLKPFFEVQVQLSNKEVQLSPNLDQIQKSINKAATAVLRCSKQLYNWNQSNKDNEKKDTFYDMIAQDKEIVKVILLLTGSIQGTRNKVNEFLMNFNKYDKIFQANISQDIKEFQATHPTLQDYEDILKKFTNTEEEIDKFTETYKIGAMELKNKDICESLKQCAKEWKLQYSQNLHKRARTSLDILSEQTKTLQIRLSKDVKDIDSLGQVIGTLEEIRKQQAEIDMKFNPVQEMYQLLDNYLQGGITDKDEQDQRSLLETNWNQLIIQAEAKGKLMQEQQKSHLKTLKSNVREFVKEVQLFREQYEKSGPMVPGISPQEAMERLRQFEDEYQVKHKFYQINARGEELFGLQQQQYPELQKTEAEIKNLNKLYNLYDTVIKSMGNFREKSWSEISRDDLVKVEEDAIKQSDQCMRLPSDLKGWQAYIELKQKIQDLKDVLPLITELKKPSILERHWQQVCDTCDKKLNYTNPDQMFIEDLINCDLLQFAEDIVEITDSADKQEKIRKNLDEIEEFWSVCEFEFANWGKREQPLMLGGLKVAEILERLDEDQMTLQGINAARHVTPFKQEVEGKIRVFSDVNETLDLWIKVQKLWSSLEPVFTGGDIARQMPLQAKSFQGIDKNWMKIMEKSVETKKVIPTCQNDMLKDFLPDLNAKLEECQNSLEDYLENKRKSFPRFYFVSDPTLLKILSQGSEPTSIQEDFEKLFDAINRVEFIKDNEKKGSNLKLISEIKMVSGQDVEVIPLGTNVKCEGNIETWLKSLETIMQESLQDICRRAVQSILQQKNNGLADFAMNEPAQVGLMGLQILWTQYMTEGLEGLQKQKGIMEEKRSKISGMMDILSKMCLEDLKTKINRMKVETLVTIQVHQYDIAQEVKCKDINDFEWQKQTRMYWKLEEDNCFISITDWDAPYCYEYLGAKERLCVTPLTDRCYITLAQAMSMYYGGAPAGPAGTGKTETVKDLGRTLGIFVVVTNCSDQHRYKDMAKIFKGLVQSGLWGCFDEFNRIDLEVLSVVAMQVEAITQGRKQHLDQFWFPEEKRQIDLNQSVSYFITMNPGYAGRQELPENLKVQFRGVTMMVPDREIIMKVKLASVGYSERGPLSKKFNVLYKLCEEQLSKQRHYDFGLRNILSVLRTAGSSKRQELSAPEEMLLMRSLRDMNLSKLVADDIPLFNGLLADIFPKQKDPPKKVYPEIEKAIPEVVKEYQTIVQTDSFTLKIIQLYETYLVRHGYMLVGPSGTGKTTIMKILTECIGRTPTNPTPTRIIRLNPKAITSQQMYGVKDDLSGDWVPGVFSTIWEKSNNRNLKHSTWIVCDGPVDAIWIENLNTVLDDNKILTLANGERILMTENCKLVFEVQDLNNASPATVSRCGQVYVSPTDLGYKSVLDGWILTRRNRHGSHEESDKLNALFDKYLNKMGILELTFSRDPVMSMSEVLRVTSFLNILNGILVPFVAQNRVLDDLQYEKIIIYSLTWSLAGLYEAEERVQFHEYLREKNCPIPSKKDNETIFEYYVSPDTLDWKLCTPEAWQPPSGKGAINFSTLLMPTLDSLRCEQIFNYIFCQEKRPKTDKEINLIQQTCLAVGGSGTAKTSSVLMFSQKFDKEKMLFKRVNFSSATTPYMFQQTIEAECDFKVGKDFAPPQNKSMTIFIDDMSMPFVNNWGDQITLEIVRQLVEQGGFYMLEKTAIGQFKNIKNLQYIGAMNHPGGGRNDIPNRMKRQCFIFNMILPLDISPIYAPIINHIFNPKKFNDDTLKVITNLTKATIELWNKVKNTMLPTPAKFHYVFNMRELSRIFKGILGTRITVINSCSQIGGVKPDVFLVGLWRHECERVFVDKMTTNKDKDTILGYINEISIENFQWLETQIQDNFSPEKHFYFCDFLREDERNEEGQIINDAEKVYECVNNMDLLRTRANQQLQDYNTKYSSKKMDLVLFDDALRHLMRINRIIQQTRSSGLLVGVGGSGKQSLTRLAAEIGRHVCQQVVINKAYQVKDLKEDIKIGYDNAGRLRKPHTFLMTDAEVKNEDFLEYINMILSTGEIPGLLQKDEKEIVFADIRNDLVKERNLGNIDPTPNDLWSYFIDRVRDNFHIILAFSPVGVKFRERARKFPALFNECTIDWFLPWPEEALVSVSKTFIDNFQELDTKAETKQQLMKHMGNVHLMVNQVTDLYFASMRRQVYVTPKSYLSFLNSYKGLYNEKYQALDVQENSYKIGLEKIQDATVTINKMEIVLKDEEVKLKEAQDQTQKLLENLEVEQKKASIKNEQVKATTDSCKQQADTIAQQRAEAEQDLLEAMPALQAAEKAVSSLKAQDIVELKSNRNPGDIIKYIIDACVIFFQGKLSPISIEVRTVNKKEINFMKESWEEGGKSTLNSMDFMNNLKNFERDQISEETMELLQPYLKAKEDWFNIPIAQKASVAAAGILAWALAIAEYHQKSKIVKPKRIFLAQQEGRLAKAQKDLAAAQEELKEIQALTQSLKDTYSKQMAEKNELENKAAKTKKKINTARQLIYSLSGEKERWGVGAKEIGEQKKKLVGNVSLSCAFISYCGAFNSEFRTKLAVDYFEADMRKRGIPVTPKLELTKFLVDDATVGEWNIQGLPKDDLSIQNGIMVTQSTRFCLFIDPQTQGQNWVTKKYEDHIDPNRSICNQTHPKFKDFFLKFCLENGKCLIVENIENEVDSMLDPVMEKQYVKKGKSLIIDVGGVQYDYDREFKLFLTCRLGNPAFSPELSAKVTIIDFTVTQGGLEQQLLGKVISKEQKALEDSLTSLLAGVNQNTKDLAKLDANLLHRLTTSTGNLLDDTQLMDVLNNTKTQAKEVAAKLIDAEIKTKEINEKREQYRPVAIRGSSLYFTIIEVAEVNWMYNSSLGQFLQLFNQAIDNSAKAQLPSKRVENIIEELTFHVFKYVNRGLFEQDKTAFMLMMCFKIQTTANKISNADIGIFLKSGAALDIKNEKAKPQPWLQDKQWLNVLALSRHTFGPVNESQQVFRELPDSISKNEGSWKTWIEKNDPENYPIPDFSERITQEKEIGPFIALSLIRALREDRSRVAAIQYIGQTLGQQYTAPISYPIEDVWKDSAAYDPVLFLLSAGADPTTTIDELAKKKKKFPCDKVSMGEGQERVANEVIKKCAESGGWIILQNCHLGLKYMEEIENNIINQEAPKFPLHEDFRLWITCEAHPKFPLGLLQKTLKVTNEPPKGIQAGLHKTFHTMITQETIEKVEHPNWHALIFTICFMHSIVVERRKFGPLGWCIPYEYNYSDLEASLLFVEKYLTNQLQTLSADGRSLLISMPVIKYMVCEVQYGGRVTDDLDRELFNEYGEKYLKDGIFQPEYQFDTIQTEGSGGSRERFSYKIPSLGQQGELTKWQEYIAVIPPNDNPEVFGLHGNADLTFRLKESLEMINTMMETRPKEQASGGGKSREEIVQDKARELLSKLPIDYNMLEVRQICSKLQGPKQLNDKGLSVPLNIFLYQELQRMQKVIGLVRKVFDDTINAIDGQIIMTPDILDAINSIFDARVPNSWLYDPSGAEISWLTPSLGNWFTSLIDRNKQLNDWMKNGRPQTYWLTGFFNPQGFLTGMKQEVTRMHKKPEKGKGDDSAWSLDDVVYKTDVKQEQYENIKDIQSEGVYVHGLYLEGCKWSKVQLEDAEPKKMFSPLPILYVTAINKKKGSGQERESNSYKCPVYKYPRRTDKYLVFRVDLNCDSPQKWKLRGVALLCSTE